MTNDARLAQMFSKYQCHCTAAHLPDSEDQPTMLDFAGSRDVLADWMSTADGSVSQSPGEEPAYRDGRSVTSAASDEDSAPEQRDQPGEARRPIPCAMDGVDRPITAAEKAMVQRAHTNFGHPPNDHFSHILRAARVKSCIMRCVQAEFSCSDCAAHPRPPRRAAIPRTFELDRSWASTYSR